MNTLEHVALGAGSYAGGAAVGAPTKRWQVGVVAVGLTAGWKEFYGDLRNHKDSPGMAIFHAVTILGGGGIVAAFWH